MALRIKRNNMFSATKKSLDRSLVYQRVIDRGGSLSTSMVQTVRFGHLEKNDRVVDNSPKTVDK
jgi:hypothetical protein